MYYFLWDEARMNCVNMPRETNDMFGYLLIVLYLTHLNLLLGLLEIIETKYIH